MMILCKPYHKTAFGLEARHLLANEPLNVRSYALANSALHLPHISPEFMRQAGKVSPLKGVSKRLNIMNTDTGAFITQLQKVTAIISLETERPLKTKTRRPAIVHLYAPSRPTRPHYGIMYTLSTDDYNDRYTRRHI